MSPRPRIPLCLAAAAALMIAGVGSPRLAAGPAYTDADPMLDTEGHVINAHGGGILRHGGSYYLYGEIKTGPTRLVSRVGWECYRVEAAGVSCYQSTDLVHWRNRGVALAPEPGNPSSDLNPGRVVERPKVVFNPRTRQFVMWMHIDTDDYLEAKAGVAVSERPEGPFRYLGSVRPNGAMARDLTLFQDADMRAYLVFSSEENQTLHVVLLSDDYLSPTATQSRVLIGMSREAPALFRSGDAYYLLSSGCTGWSPNAAAYATAAHPLGPWTQHGNPCTGPGAATTFGGQGTFVLPLAGTDGQFLFMADLWNKTDLADSRYLWLPMVVTDGVPRILGRP